MYLRFLSIQIMVFSFMGQQHGRILQAYSEEKELIIRKSRLYDFTTKEKALAHARLFAQYMANEPVGNTKSLPARQPNR